MGTIARLQLRQILGQRKFLLVVAFLALPIALTLLIRLGGGMPPRRDLELFTGIYLYFLYPQSASILLALLYGTAILNAEIHNQTITYLFTRPLARWKIVLGKYLVNVAVLTAVTVPSVVISWLVLGTANTGSILFGVCIAVVAATVAFNAIFALFGVLLSRRAMILGLVYVGVFEFLLSFLPAVLNNLTVTYYLRSIVFRTADIRVPREMLRVVGDASMTTSLAFPVGIAAVALALTTFVATQREFPAHEQP
jgi:ABC-2 type transport system permease protein